MTILIVYLRLICIYSIMFIFSHLSLIIIMNKISVFIHLEVATERSSIKELHQFYISAKQIKIACESVSFSLKLQAIVLQLY